jgi:hypothetical protein
LFDPEVSRHILGTPPNFAPGNADAIRQRWANGETATIAAIRNRHWTADIEANEAFIVYDGFLKPQAVPPGFDPNKPFFFVAERLSIQDGLIREILIAPVLLANGKTTF